MRVTNSLMTKFVLATSLVVGAVASSNHANATTYDFSYTFDTSDIISGSFIGTQIGAGPDVNIVSNISASLNGTPLVGSGSLYAFHFAPPGSAESGSNSLGGAVASFNPLNNNFIFSDASSIPGANYFYIIPWSNGSTANGTQFWNASLYIDLGNAHYIPNNWSLAAVSATPLPSTWLMLLSGFVGLGFFSYRGTKKHTAAIAAA